MAIPKKIKKIVEQRAKGCCEYCQCVALYIPVPFTMEHINFRLLLFPFGFHPPSHTL